MGLNSALPIFSCVLSPNFLGKVISVSEEKVYKMSTMKHETQ